MFIFFSQTFYGIENISVEPVLSGTVFSGHPLLSGDVVKSQKFHNINTIKETFIERSPLLSGRGHLFTVPNLICNCVETVLNGHSVSGN